MYAGLNVPCARTALLRRDCCRCRDSEFCELLSLWVVRFAGACFGFYDFRCDGEMKDMGFCEVISACKSIICSESNYIDVLQLL